ncbi:MAG: histidine phosphatase family protein [Thermonemataceae bacterium]|nr:histidine phosphatase family protein [Thermonemataceae bacterium]
MFPKNIYLLRHAETEYNRKGMVQGKGIDADLNETGLEQARKFYEHYQHLPLQKIYISTLKRTQQTVEQFFKKNVEVEKHEGLDEISWGIHEGKPFTKEAHQEYLFYTSAWRNGQTNVAITEGETPDEVQYRQQIFTKVLLKDAATEIMVCSHGRAMRILLAWWLGYPLKYMDYFEHRNTSFYHLRYTGSAFHILTHNSLSHLQES